MKQPEPSAREKRIAYAVWFCIALAVDLLMDLTAGRSYRPSLVGLAIMITSVLFIAHSWIRDR